MKKKQTQATKKKRTILAASAVGLIALIGGAIAYNSETGFFSNLFHLGTVGPESFIETFESPGNWSCQEETPKTVRYQNNTGTTRVVRIKMEEYWKTANSTSTNHETELPLEKDGHRMTIINLQNRNDWEYNDEDGYYYYKYKVPDGVTTSKFMKSVIFNCDLMTSEEFECTDTNDGKQCTSTENEYSKAKYHIYITIQTEEEGANDWPYTPIDKPERDTLYDIVAKQTKGIDLDLNILDYNTDLDDIAPGVYTFHKNKTDEYPVYYFTGSRTNINNSVKLGNTCWRIYITSTGTGGTKLLYDGDVVDGTCENSWKNSTVNGGIKYANNVSSSTIRDLSYMIGDSDEALRTSWVGNRIGTMASTGGLVFGKNVSWDGEKYTLQNTYTIADSFATEYNTVFPTYRYTCQRYASSPYYDPKECTEVSYLIGMHGGAGSDATDFTYYTLRNGDTVESMISKALTPKNESLMSTAINQFYEDKGLAEFEDKFEPVVFCNDKTLHTNAFNGHDSSVIISPYNNDATKGMTKAFLRNVLHNEQYSHSTPYVSTIYNPDLGCSNASRDLYSTANADRGNKKLKHPIGMMTADEGTLAQLYTDNSYLRAYEQSGSRLLTYMYILGTASNYYSKNFFIINNSGMVNPYGTPTTTNYRLRPVVSLQHETYVASGTGSSSDPYVLEWDD